MKMFLFCFIILISNLCIAQKKGLKTENIFLVPEKHETNIDSLASYFNKTYKEDSTKIKAIYVWIATHILYDYKLLKMSYGSFYNQEDKVVFKNRIAVCAGYANLFHTICTKCNIQCEVITGFAYSKEKINLSKINDTRHGWNAARINGKWYLYDVTWASNRYEYNKQLNGNFWYYFQTDPYLFSSGHLPDDDMWQLRENIISYPNWFNRKQSDFIKQNIKPKYNFDSIIQYQQKLKETQLINLKFSEDFYKNLANLFKDISININAYENLIYKRNSRTMYSISKDLFENDSFLQNQKLSFTNYYKIIDSIQNLLNDTILFETDSTNFKNTIKLKQYFERELICLERFINFSKFRKSGAIYRPVYSKWVMENAYTKAYENEFYEKEMDFCVFFNINNVNSINNNIKQAGYFGSFDFGLGYIHKNYTFKCLLDVMLTNYPNYFINFNNTNKKAISASANNIMLQTDYKYYRYNKLALFFSSGLGLNMLTQYVDKETSKVVNDLSPRISIGHSVTYRYNILYYFSLNTGISYLNNSTNLGQNLSGIIYNIGIGVGFGANKMW